MDRKDHSSDRHNPKKTLASPPQKLNFDQKFEFDHLLKEYFGEWGFFQIIMILLLSIPACSLSAYNFMDVVFICYTPGHICNVAQMMGLDEGVQNNVTLSDSVHSCEVTIGNFSKVKCTAWQYDKTYFEETLATKWNLVCDKAIVLRTMIGVLSFATLSSTFNAYVMDKYGRKKAFLLDLCFFLTGGCFSLFAVSPTYWTIFKFIGSISCMWNIAYTWSMEFVGPGARTKVSAILAISYSVATMTLSLIGYLCSDWRQFAMCTTIPFIGLFSFLFIVPESPRWLIHNGEVEKAMRVLRQMGKWNRIPEKSVDYENIQRLLEESKAQLRSEHRENFDMAHFFQSANLRRKALALTFIAVLGNQLFYAIPFTVESLESNLYVSFAVQSLVEIPAAFVFQSLVERFGRIRPLTFVLIMGSVLCLLSWPMQNVHDYAVLAATAGCRFFVAMSVNICAQLINELYPTIGRGVGGAVILGSASVANFSMQYTILSSNVWKPLPKIIFSLFALIGAFVALFLPDTKNIPLPDSVEQAEAQGSVGFESFKINTRFLAFSRSKLFKNKVCSLYYVKRF